MITAAVADLESRTISTWYVLSLTGIRKILLADEPTYCHHRTLAATQNPDAQAATAESTPSQPRKLQLCAPSLKERC